MCTSEAGSQYYVAWLKLVLSCFVHISSDSLHNDPLVTNRASLGRHSVVLQRLTTPRYREVPSTEEFRPPVALSN
jgi:hypothetical protein